MSRSGAAPLASGGIITPGEISHAGIQAALNSGAALGLKVVAGGSYTTDQTLYISSDCDLSELTITYTGTGDCIVVGTPATGHLHRKVIGFPTIFQAGYTPGVWVPNTRGIVLRNIFRSQFSIPRISNFYYGLVEIGDGSYGLGGFAYNRITITSLDNNFVNEKLQLDNQNNPNLAFCNENVRVGGSWSHIDIGQSVPVPGMRHIVLGNIVNGSQNNNRWIGCSLEGTQDLEEYLVECYGTDNQWIACRWEYDWNHKPPTWWRNGSARNTIISGVESDNIVPTVEAGGQVPTIIGGNAAYFNTTNPGGVVFSSSAGGSNNAWSVMPGGWQATQTDPTTGYIMRLSASGKISLKNSVDTSDRWSVDMSSRTVRFGAGINTNALTMSWGSGSPNTVITANPGSLYFDYTNNLRYNKASGTGNTGWQLDGFPNFTTAARPTAASAGLGGTYYDTTLSKPAWSDGTVWRDAIGTAI